MSSCARREAPPRCRLAFWQNQAKLLAPHHSCCVACLFLLPHLPGPRDTSSSTQACPRFVGRSSRSCVLGVMVDSFSTARTRGRLCTSATTTFSRADWSSRHIVPRETPIRFPAVSCSKPSPSTSRMASNSGARRRTGVESFRRLGLNVTGEGISSSLTGLGGLPRPCHPRRYRISLRCDLPHRMIYIFLCIYTEVSVHTHKTSEVTGACGNIVADRQTGKRVRGLDMARSPISRRGSDRAGDMVRAGAGLPTETTLESGCVNLPRRLNSNNRHSRNDTVLSAAVVWNLVPTSATAVEPRSGSRIAAARQPEPDAQVLGSIDCWSSPVRATCPRIHGRLYD
jgi:hypothetical protein